MSKITNPLAKKHLASLIFFHGAGDTGANLAAWIKDLLGQDLAFPHIKLIYPTAPLQPYTLYDGEKVHVWFDRHGRGIDAPPNQASISAIHGFVQQLLSTEMAQGVPVNKILVGGFSQGGSLALHTAYHLNLNVAGAFACGSYLNNISEVYDTLGRLGKGTKMPPLRMLHGDKDDVVPFEWGRITFEKLKSLGVKGKFIMHKDTEHELTKKQLNDLKRWISKRLPDAGNK